MPDLDVHDPWHNIREVCKQAILLEDHLLHPEKRCQDCINKHLLTMEALVEEACTLDTDGVMQGFLEGLLGWCRMLQRCWAMQQDPQEIGQKIRDVRKHLTPKVLLPRIVVGRYLVARLLRTAASIRIVDDGRRVQVMGPYQLMQNIIPGLKRRKFRYDPTYKSWWQPSAAVDREDLEKLVHPYSNVETPRDRVERELRERTSKGLLVRVPYDLRQVPRDLGGLWDQSRKMWAMPDQESLEKVHQRVQEEQKTLAEVQLQRQEEQTERRKRSILSEIEHNLSVGGLSEKDLVVLRSFSERGGARWAVGDTLRDPKTKQVVTIGWVPRPERVEDGLSFGYPADDGWSFTYYAIPASAVERESLEGEERRQLTRQQASRRHEELVKLVRQGKNYHPLKRQKRLQGEKLLLRGARNVIYGGGTWWVITPTHIWFVQNNGADGDDWSRNNVLTGGAGAIGYRVRYSKDLADELHQMDAIIGEK